MEGVKLNLEKVPPHIFSSFITETIGKIVEDTSKIMTAQSNGITTVVVLAGTEENAESIMSELNKYFVHGFNEYLEKKTGKDRKSFHRGNTAYEHIIEGGTLRIQWR